MTRLVLALVTLVFVAGCQLSAPRHARHGGGGGPAHLAVVSSPTPVATPLPTATPTPFKIPSFAPLTTATVRGMVCDPQGRPLSGGLAQLEEAHKASPHFLAAVMVDEGQYVIEGAPRFTRLELIVAVPGYRPARVWLENLGPGENLLDAQLTPLNWARTASEVE